MRTAELTNRFTALEAGQDESSRADQQVHGIGGCTG